ARAEARAKIRRERLQRRCHVDVELEIAEHLRIARAERGEPRGIVGGLGGDAREACECLPRERAEPRVTGCRARRQPRVDEVDGYAAPRALAQEVRPHL